MKRKQDSVQVITCEQANLDANVVKATAETVLEDLGANENLEFNILPSETGRRTADIVREFVVEKSEYIDFLFCGNRGADFSGKDKNSYLGSVSNEIVRTTKLNLFFMV
jgi:nucleotide-binding universal stress UspA family protein